jgi:hypothetical protein
MLTCVLAASMFAPASGEVEASSDRAFPGAEGFGADALGGRGGDVYVVTTLADAGPGSLREGLGTATAPRTIVFEVAGYIDLASPLRFVGSHLTIAGQSSPGGVTIAGYPFEVVNSEHIVIRYMRFRPGDRNAAAVPGKPGRGNADLVGDATDALTIIGSSNVIVDHVSASWSMDETLSVTKSANVTVSHSIISESLNDSFHTEGTHGFGSLVRGTGENGYSFVGNYWAHHQRRMPAIGGQQDPPAPGEPGAGLDIDLVNNVMYDWLLFPNHVLSNPFDLRVNLHGNIYIAGPSSQLCLCPWINWESTAEQLNIARSGNVLDVDRNNSTTLLPLEDDDFVGPVTFAAAPFNFDRPSIAVLDSSDTLAQLFAEVGASHHRDWTDLRVLLQLVFRVNTVIDSVDDVGGWPAIPVYDIPFDADRDGMADSWEWKVGLDTKNHADHAGFDLDSAYTNLEIYLDGLLA